LLIVSDGTSVAIEDKDLETQDRLPLRATPLGLILDDKIDFAEQVNILGVRKTENIVGVLMEDKTGETEGSLLLVLDAADYGLLEWQAIDPEGGVTSVQLAGVETGISLNPRLFRIEELDEEDERD
jgi:outer membrane lipoprotein-sorting protein